MGTAEPPKVNAAGGPGPATAARLGLIACHDCGLLSRFQAGGRLYCPRCGGVLHARKPNSEGRSWALVLAAILFYIPANVLPVTHTTYLGSTQSDTILSGVYYFITSGSWHIALIIFVASIVVPALKILALAFLLVSVHRQSEWRPEERTRLYLITEIVGRWSMVDVYVVTVMVALLKLGALANVDAGVGIVFFGAVVVITMFAANSFDPRLIWDAMEKRS
ncbi:MAG: paraquat-inducible protein A [Desulfobacterales bacterium]|nr:paraquat-inducible protein A [Desulfobacterales bacterium]